jgi:hypothetical protein
LEPSSSSAAHDGRPSWLVEELWQKYAHLSGASFPAPAWAYRAALKSRFFFTRLLRWSCSPWHADFKAKNAKNSPTGPGLAKNQVLGAVSAIFARRAVLSAKISN